MTAETTARAGYDAARWASAQAGLVLGGAGFVGSIGRALANQRGFAGANATERR